LGNSHQEALERIRPHLVEKYVQLDGSYGRVYPALWMRAFGAELAQQSKEILTLTTDSPYYTGLLAIYNNSIQGLTDVK
jgi:hypothetical protein